MTRGFILPDGERDRESVRACVLYENTKLWTQFYISDLLGNRDGSDQSVHLRNKIRLFFFSRII